jgi:hypothetical protein
MRKRVLLTVLGTFAAGMLLVASAIAAKPVIETVPIDETNVITCQGFVVNESVEGTIKIRSFFEDGEIAREIISFSLVHTFTNPDTGESVSSPDVGIDFVRIAEDGSVTVMIIGIVGRFTVPGEGLIAADLGRIVLFFEGPEDEEPDVIFEAGKHTDLTAAVCEALAP